MKSNTKKTLFIVGSICSMIVLCIVFGFFGKNKDDIIMNRIVGIVAIISGLGSLLMGISSIFSTSLDNVREYYATGDTPDMAKARQVLYNYRYIKMKFGKSIFDNDFDEWAQSSVLQEDKVLNVTTRKEILDAMVLTSNFFQMWGLLQSKGFLPVWVFETASGYSILKLHDSVEDIFEKNRETNPFYAMQFTALCERIAKKYKKAIRQCVENERAYVMRELGLTAEQADAHLAKRM